MTYGSSHDIRNFQDLLKTQKCKVLNIMQLTVMKYQCYLWGVSHFLVEFNSKSFEACFFSWERFHCLSCDNRYIMSLVFIAAYSILDKYLLTRLFVAKLQDVFW